MEAGDRVRIVEGGPHENIGKTGVVMPDKVFEYPTFLVTLDGEDGVFIYRESELALLGREYPTTLTQQEVSIILCWAGICENEGLWDDEDEPLRAKLHALWTNIKELDPV